MSKTVDSRVLEMRFDNGQFESNARTSISTLEKLKQSLKMPGASAGIEKVGAAAKGMNFDSVAQSVSALENRFSTMGIVGMRVIMNLTDSMMNLAKRTMSFLTSGIVQGGISRAMKLEQAHFQLQGLLKDETEVTAVMKNVNDAVDGTAYGLDAAATVASQLAASGMKAGQQMYSSLRAVAGVAAMTNSSYEDIGRIFTQVAGQGRLMGQDLLQLSSRGINAAATIAKYLGKTEAEVRDMVSKGQISFETFAAAMDDAFGEHAKKANETFTGAMSNVKASLARIGAEFVSPLIVQNGPLVKFFNVLRERINDVKANIGPLAEMFTGSVTKMANGATNALKKLDLTNYVKGFVNIVKSVANIFKGLWSLIKPIGQAFLDIFPPRASEAILKSTENIKKMTSAFKVSDETADKMRRTFKGLFSVLDMVMKAATAVGKVIVSFFTSGIVTGILDFILTITASIGDFFTALNSGFGLDSLTKIFTGLSEVVGNLLDGFSGIGDSLSGVGDAVLKVVSGIGKALKSAFSWITDNISLGDIFTGLLGGGAYVAIKKIIELVEKLKSVFGGGLLSIIFGGGKEEAAEGGLSIAKKFSNVLDAVNNSLQAFTNGIKIGSLVAIAAAIAILASALDTISQIKAVNITKSLFAIGIMFGMLTTSFKSISKTLDVFAGKGIVKAGLTLMMLAKAIGILADAMKEMSGLSFAGIAKGLIGIGGSVAALALGLKAIDGVKVKITTIIAISVMASAIKKMAGSLAELGKMTWGEIGRGLSAMGGALTELVIVLKVFDKLSGFKSFAGAAGLVLAVQSLDEIADALTKLGQMSWGEIGRGLSAMGGALAEIAGVSGVLGKLGGFSSLLGSTAIVTTVKGLGQIADALSEIGILSWGEIARGLSGMGGALTEVASISGVLGKLAGISGIIGSGSILIAVQGLGKIGDALSQVGSLSWGEIARGLAGIGGALLEVAGISGALGYLTNVAGLLGAATIWVGVQGLEKLANALSTIGAMTWSEIGRGLTGMAGALLEVGGISGALGYFTNIAGLLGAATIWTGVQGLEKLANALKKFGEMNWEEIGRGLTAMGAALGEVALGSLLNTLSGIGAMAISEVAEPLGQLADSVKKWSGVKVPEDLGKQIGSLAVGVAKFTFSGLGSMSISEVAEPLGVMAESVKKWSGVKVPEGLGDNLKTLADGITSFTFSGLGGMSISAAAEPLGVMAESVKKWSGVKVPEGLGDNLKTLANGIMGFSFAFMGGWSLETIVSPLGKLASSVKKWNGVSVPEGIGGQLKKLANGVMAFTFSGFGGLSLSSVAKPLGQLADSVKKWSGVKVPDSLGENLKKLASGLRSFMWVGNVSNAADSMAKISTAAKKLNGVNYNSIASGLKTLSSSLKSFASSTSSLSGVGSKITSNIIKPINNLGPKLKSAGSKLASSLASGMKSSGAVKSAASSMVSAASKVVSSKASTFKNAGVKMGTNLADGIKSKSSSVKSAINSLINSASSQIRGKYKTFYSAGAYLGQGLANGIKSKSGAVNSAATSLANKAASAVRNALKINSPSKVFIKIGSSVPEGFAKGIGKFGNYIKSSAYSMADSAFAGTKTAMNRVSNLIDSGLDAQPTIRPVINLDDVKTGVEQVNSMLGWNATIETNANLESINAAMNRRNQNGGNEEVISAIDRLRNDLNNISQPTYNVGGITYDDGSNIADAIKSLIQVARVERRV